MSLVRVFAAASIALCLATAAHAQKRLEIFENWFNPSTGKGEIWRIWSDDNGLTYSGWSPVPAQIQSGCNYYYPTIAFEDTPAVVSDQPGRLWIVSKDDWGALVDNVYTTNGGWRGWCYVPGQATWNFQESPALASWGPGRLDVFIHKKTSNDACGGVQLRHTWADNGRWSGSWDVPGTGCMQGSPTAVSWGWGRIDVFVRGGGNELAHRWYDNGRWWGWESLGTPAGVALASSPAVTSPGTDRVNIFATGSDGQLWGIWYAYGWGGWGTLGGSVGHANTPWAGTVSPAASSRAPMTLDVFVLGSSTVAWAGGPLYQASYDYYDGGWHGFRYEGNFSTNVAVTYWDPYVPQPQPNDGGGSCGPFPC